MPERIVLTATTGEYGGYFLHTKDGEPIAYKYNQREKKIFLDMADAARGIAIATGSVGAKQIETMFGVEIEVSWKRS